MTDVTADHLALRRAVAAVRVERDVIRAFGPDSASFLQGQLSQDVEALQPGESAWSLLLDPQGKVVAWLRVWGRRGDEVLMDVAAGWGQSVIDRLNRFRIRIRTELELLDWQCVSMRGPDCPELDDLDVRCELAADVAWPGASGVDLLGPSVDIPEGMLLAGTEALESVRIEAGWPAMGSEFPPGDPSVIPAEVGEWLVEASVSFTKGCYTGQELVARVDSRGSNTPRKLRGVVVDADVAPPVGAELVVDGQVRGALSSVGASLDLAAPVALVLAHRSVEPPCDATIRSTGPDGTIQELAAQVRELPLVP